MGVLPKTNAIGFNPPLVASAAVGLTAATGAAGAR